MRQNKFLLVAAALSLLVAGIASAQGIPTATLTGRVINDGQGLPGVSVTAKSPALQGTRTAVTNMTGDYVFAGVPPGDYTIAFALSGFQTVTRSIKLSASQQSQLDASLALSSVAAEATVVGRTESISQTSQEATTYTADLLSKLPTPRTINSAVLLLPGLNQNGPNNAVSISGAQSGENLYTVNGVVIQDNMRGQPNLLFIEDAISETTTSTSSVSAELGRFTGGVVNTITKSGGNTFSGSLRSTLWNDSWQALSAYRDATGRVTQSLANTVIPVYEATLGGPILTDKLWFFGAGRYYDSSTSGSAVTGYTGISYTTGNKELRYEGKLTLSPFQSHTLTGSYINTNTEQFNNWYTSASAILDLDSLYDRKLPQDLLALNYNGVLSDSLFVEAQYSKRKYKFDGGGSIYTDLIRGTLLLDQSRGNARYNSPTFCGVCDPETRDNDNYLVKGTYFLSTSSLGSHNLVAGYDDFGGQRKANNYQSGSNYRIYGTSAILAANGDIFPVFDSSTLFLYQPIEQLSQGSDVRTRSAYLNDSWRLNNRLSFNVGLRYDKNRAQDSRGVVTSNDSAFSPRLAGVYDVKGDGSLKITASYAKYVAAIQENQAGAASQAGNSSTFYWYYDGPGANPINPDPLHPTLSKHDAVQAFFDWFRSEGCLPDPLAASCKVPQASAPGLPGVNTQIQGSLASPNANEYVLGIAGTIGARGSFRADVVRREYRDFYDLKKDMTTGKVSDANGNIYDLGLVVNSNGYRREYTGLHTQFAFRLGDRLNVGGNWTWSHLLGNIVGETAVNGTVQGTQNIYPEYSNPAWSNPVGDLPSDQRHRVRLYATYDLPVPAKLGNLNVALIQAWDTGQPYGAVGTVATRSFVTNPGYTATPSSVNYYFTARNAFHTEDVYRTDLSFTYSKRIAGAVELYVTPQIVNLFNAQHITNVNTNVETRVTNSGSYAAFNPFTDKPVQGARGTGANWNYGPLFGKPTGPTSYTGQGTITPFNAPPYQVPRYFQVSVGVRF